MYVKMKMCGMQLSHVEKKMYALKCTLRKKNTKTSMVWSSMSRNYIWKTRKSQEEGKEYKAKTRT